MCVLRCCGDLIESGAFGKAEPGKASNQWSAAMFPLAEQLVLLQSNLLVDIAAHDMVQNPDAASARVVEVLHRWRRFAILNIYKAHLANAPPNSEDFELEGGKLFACIS